MASKVNSQKVLIILFLFLIYRIFIPVSLLFAQSDTGLPASDASGAPTTPESSNPASTTTPSPTPAPIPPPVSTTPPNSTQLPVSPPTQVTNQESALSSTSEPVPTPQNSNNPLMFLVGAGALVAGALTGVILKVKKSNEKKEDEPCSEIKKELSQKQGELKIAESGFSVQEAIVAGLKKKLEDAQEKVKEKIIDKAKDKALEVVGNEALSKTVHTAEKAKKLYESLTDKYEQSKKALELLKNKKDNLTNQVDKLDSSCKECMLRAAAEKINLQKSSGAVLPGSVSSKIKLISLNMENNRHYDVIFPLVKKENPDVICFQEVLEEDFEMIKNKFGMKGIFQARSYVTFHLFPDVRGKRYGIAIFAKNFKDSGTVYYEGDGEAIKKPFKEWLINKEENRKEKNLLWIDTKDEGGKNYRFITTHFTLTKNGEATPYQLETLDMLFRELDKLGEFVLCGDMNAPRGRETFSRLAKKYKDNIPEEYKTSLDQKLHRVPGLMLMVDGLFTTSTYKATNVKLVDGVSDHMAVVAEIEKVA